LDVDVGEGPRVFFCPPHGGGGVEYQAFLPLISGLQLPFYGFDLLFEPHDSLPLWADSMANEMVALQSAGPYLVVGFGYGSSLAWMVAARLRSSGQSVRLALLDPWHRPATPLAWLARWILMRVKGTLRLLRSLAQVPTSERRPLIQKLPDHLRMLWRYGYWIDRGARAQSLTRHPLSPVAIAESRIRFKQSSTPFPCSPDKRSIDHLVCLGDVRPQIFLSRGVFTRPMTWSGEVPQGFDLHAVDKAPFDFSPQPMRQVGIRMASVLLTPANGGGVGGTIL